MKNLAKMIIVSMSIFFISSCEKDEGNLPNISFKTGGTYLSSDVVKTVGSSILIGINSSKSEKRDVLKKFNISKSIDGGAAISIFNKDISKSEEDSYAYDLTTTIDATAGQVVKYVFTITNRDGLTNQVALNVTAQ
ncbi:MAG: hypothetical protein HYR91_08960 [Flavobacteriia bacterium]|nr:hypothetical protein [Flavobacteriia bacterium]